MAIQDRHLAGKACGGSYVPRVIPGRPLRPQLKLRKHNKMKTIQVRLSEAEYCAFSSYANDLMENDENTLFACIDHVLGEIQAGTRFWQTVHTKAIQDCRTRGERVPSWAVKSLPSFQNEMNGSSRLLENPDEPAVNGHRYHATTVMPEYRSPVNVFRSVGRPRGIGPSDVASMVPEGPENRIRFTDLQKRLREHFGCSESNATVKIKEAVLCGAIEKDLRSCGYWRRK